MITIDFNKESLLINEYLKNDNVQRALKPTLLSKFGLTDKNPIDIYFHSGSINKESIIKMKSAKKVITTSKALLNDICASSNIDNSKIEVIYPCINEEKLKQKESKKTLLEEFDFDKKDKIILFTAKNLKLNGVKEFCDLIVALSYSKIQVIIEGEKTQINSLKFQLNKYSFKEKIIFLEDYTNMPLLFSAADIFILPTYMKGFATNVLLAMYHKTAVFVSANSASSEIIDVYSTMESPTDKSMPFKVDALLLQKDDLKLIKKQNNKLAENYTILKQLAKVEKIASNI